MNFEAVSNHLVPFVQAAANLTIVGKQHGELEARLGIWDDISKQFVPGVSEQHFYNMLRLMENSTEWDSTANWIETVDSFLHGGIRHTKCSNGNRSGFIKKCRVMDTQIETTGRSKYCIRVSLSTEAEDLSCRVKVGKVNYVRIKQRKQVVFVAAGGSSWLTMDFTKVKCGRSETEARETNKIQYEVEVEADITKINNDNGGHTLCTASLLTAIGSLFIKDVSDQTYELLV
jgi:hypothetical protein